MKKSLKIIITIIVMMLCNHIYAQNKIKLDSINKPSLGKDLLIDEVKAAKLQSIMLISQNRIDTLLKNKNITPAERHKIIMPILIERENQIKSLLTAEQQEKLKILTLNHLGQKRKENITQLEVRKEEERMMQMNQRANTNSQLNEKR